MRWAIAVVSTVISLLLAEFSLRITNFSFDLYPEKVEFGYPSPKALARHFKPDPDLFWVGRDYYSKLRALRESKPQFVFMGDSCTAHSDYPARLIERLSQDNARQIKSVNVAVEGFSSYQGLKQLERDVLSVRPTLVTFYYGWNDHWTGYGLKDSSMQWLQSDLFQTARQLRIFQLITKVLVWLKAARIEEKPLRVPPEEFARNLRQMVELSRRAGITPVLVTAPSSHRPGHEPAYLKERWLKDLADLIPLHSEYVKLVRKVAAEVIFPQKSRHGFSVVDNTNHGENLWVRSSMKSSAERL